MVDRYEEEGYVGEPCDDDDPYGEDWSDKVLHVIDTPVSYTHLRAHETVLDLVCRLLLEKKK